MRPMTSDLEMKIKNIVWYSPIYIEKHLQRTYKAVDRETFETHQKYKRAREMRLGRVLALCLNAFQGSDYQHFVGLPPTDPPDFCIVGKKIGTKEPPMIYSVEATTYIGSPKKDIVTHLVDADKFPKDHHNFGETDIILINIGIGLTPDLHTLNAYLKEIKAPYMVWSLQDVSRDGTTIGLFTEVYPNFRQIEVNVALEGIKLQSKQPAMERITLVKSGPTKSGTITEMNSIPDKIPWE